MRLKLKNGNEMEMEEHIAWAFFSPTENKCRWSFNTVTGDFEHLKPVYDDEDDMDDAHCGDCGEECKDVSGADWVELPASQYRWGFDYDEVLAAAEEFFSAVCDEVITDETKQVQSA